MELNDIKKLLYKTKPTAYFMYARLEKNVCNLYYRTLTPHEFFFRIPVMDMGEATFYPEMQAQYLIRYLIEDFVSSGQVM